MSPPATATEPEAPAAPVADAAAAASANTPATAPKAAPAAEPAAKPAEPTTPAAQTAPAPIALVVPADVTMPEGRVAELNEYATRHGIPQATAQAMLDEELAARKERMGNWKAELQADPEVGGAKFDASRLHVRNAVLAIWGPELLAEISASGADHYPAFFKGLAKFGATLSESGGVIRGAPTVTSKKKSDAELFFGDMKKEGT